MDRPRFTPTWLPSELLLRIKGMEHNWIGFSGKDLPFPVAMSLGRAPDGRLICTGLLIANLDLPAIYDPPADAPEWYGSQRVEVTPRSLRKLPLAELLESVVALRDDPRGRAFFREIFRLADELPTLPRRRPGPRGYDRAHFEQVADAYRAALAHTPHAPIKALAQQLHYSEATVRRWLQRARDMGLLGASTPGRAGELPARVQADTRPRRAPSGTATRTRRRPAGG